jgi:hypothetical protein
MRRGRAPHVDRDDVRGVVTSAGGDATEPAFARASVDRAPVEAADADRGEEDDRRR